MIIVYCFFSGNNTVNKRTKIPCIFNQSESQGIPYDTENDPPAGGSFLQQTGIRSLMSVKVKIRKSKAACRERHAALEGLGKD
jgi:hypothetical protein